MSEITNTSEATLDDNAGCQPAPAVRERVGKFIHELAHNPAVTCQFTFNWHGNQGLADKASTRIRLSGLLMREEWSTISFALLKRVTFHYDYELALKEAVGIDRSASVPTKEAGGFSVGMMVRVADGVELVMHVSVALALASDDAEQSDWAQHVVRHELCHVDDFAFKRSLMAKRPEL